jgi:porin
MSRLQEALRVLFANPGTRALSQQNQAFRALSGALYVGLLSVISVTLAAHADAAPPLFAWQATDVADVLANARGGIATGMRVLDKFDVTATFDGGAYGGLDGWSAFADLQATDATNFSAALVGDLQTVSNIDAPAGVRLMDAWAAYDFDGVGSLKAGIVDLNSEFDVQQTGALFLNSSHGIAPDFSQSGQNGPSIFPTAGLGLVGSWIVDGHWQLKAGVFEGVPGDPAHPGRESIALTGREGALFVFEARNRPSPNWVLALGGWVYTAAFDTLDGGRSRGNAGLYAMTDAKLYASPGNDDHGLSAWLRAGVANSSINPVAAYVGGGLVYTGIFADADQAGVAVAAARLGGAAKTQLGLGDGETALEATYAAVVFDWLTVQPDIQYVISPGGDPSLDDALVIGSRIFLTLN